MVYPIISIIIPTFNSGDTLQKTLESVKKQSYPEKKIETLIIDGGSFDNSIKIAKSYKCKIVENSKTDLIFAKHIGYLIARGKYLVFLDSDEILENPNSLKIKYSAFQKNNRVRAVMIGGYKTPKDYSAINNYSNEFGDPFSYFIYKESKEQKFLLRDWTDKYKKIYENRYCAIFDFKDVRPLPIVELWAGGCMIDLKYARSAFPQIMKNPSLLAHLFYLLNKKNCLLAITKNDPTIHYSSENLRKYLKKITSRIKNNVYQTQMGEGGFWGREKFQPLLNRFKKFLFIPYSFSLILPIIDATYLAITRQKLIYLLHPILCIYTALLVLYYFSLKVLKIRPKMQTYGI